MFAAGTIFGAFLGDELVWNGAAPTNVSLAAGIVKRDVPGLIVWQNEAYPVLTLNVTLHGAPANYTHVPAHLDWFSLDFYPDEGVWFNVTDIYSRLVFPLMGSNQSALYVPPAYSSTPGAAANKTCPPKGDCEAEMLAWAQDAMRWASAPDSRIIGLVPWHWKSYDGVGRFVTGASTMPAVRALWAAIGDKIING